MEVNKPTIKVTANPFTGPDPNENNTKATIKVVTLESTMVIKARS